MRIVGGAWRGRRLIAPEGAATRPTADRARQALFDVLTHAPWAGPDVMQGADVLDAFAGTGALGLEALSRGAAHATFMEHEPASLRVLGANIAACQAEALCTVVAGDVLMPHRSRPPLPPQPSWLAKAGHPRLGVARKANPRGPCTLAFLDPPYQRELVPRALAALSAAGWIGPGTLIVAETGRDEFAPNATPALAERIYGAARITIWRMN